MAFTGAVNGVITGQCCAASGIISFLLSKGMTCIACFEIEARRDSQVWLSASAAGYRQPQPQAPRGQNSAAWNLSATSPAPGETNLAQTD